MAHNKCLPNVSCYDNYHSSSKTKQTRLPETSYSSFTWYYFSNDLWCLCFHHSLSSFPLLCASPSLFLLPLLPWICDAAFLLSLLHYHFGLSFPLLSPFPLHPEHQQQIKLPKIPHTCSSPLTSVHIPTAYHSRDSKIGFFYSTPEPSKINPFGMMNKGKIKSVLLRPVTQVPST